MAIRIRKRDRQRQFHRRIRAGDRTMTFVQDGHGPTDGVAVPSIEEIEAALAEVPEDLSWDWARTRLCPVFERGYSEGVPGDPMVNTSTSLGVGIGFGIDFGPALGRVTRSMAQRWEASVEQLEHAAFDHLASVVAQLGPQHLQTIVARGHLCRALGEPAGWASSAILAGEPELTRIFGTRDAIFTAPARHALLAFGPETPPAVVAEITALLEADEPHPLELDPFILEAGRLSWEGTRPNGPIDGL
jgi:hypothetical protein